MEINSAIVHIFDSISNITVFSDKKMDTTDNTISSYLIKHISKASKDSKLRLGVFIENSSLKHDLENYLKNGISFEDMSKDIAKAFFESVQGSDKVESSDLIICDYNNDDSDRILTIMNFDNKIGFTHQVLNQSGKIQNNIIRYFAYLPMNSQKIEEYAFVNLSNFEIFYCDKLRYIDGKDVHVFSDRLLQCTSSLSTKESISVVTSAAKTIAEKNGLNTTSIISHAKNYIINNAEVDNEINMSDFSGEIFPNSSNAQNEFMQQIEQAGINDKIELPKNTITKIKKNQKIRTDTGIEIIFPVDYFNNKDLLEFINNPDGTISIQIKNINRIINK